MHIILKKLLRFRKFVYILDYLNYLYNKFMIEITKIVANATELHFFLVVNHKFRIMYTIDDY